jgi:hypothetical protein
MDGMVVDVVVCMFRPGYSAPPAYLMCVQQGSCSVEAVSSSQLPLQLKLVLSDLLSEYEMLECSTAVVQAVELVLVLL